jgi:hypothetical protein
MLVISSREFRNKQKSYLDKADEGLEDPARAITADELLERLIPRIEKLLYQQ